nr:uncharacterized protein LOC104098835 [Nicotiana tomentosiformis]
MADKFVTVHVGAKKAETTENDIFVIKQPLGEGLGNFHTRFNKVRMTLPNVSEGMTVAAFQNGLSRDGSRVTKKLLSRLMKYPPTTWDEIHNAYCAEVSADDDDLNGPTRMLVSVQAEFRKERRDNIRRDHPVSRPNREQHHPFVRAPALPSFRYDEGPSRPRTRTHWNERDEVRFEHQKTRCPLQVPPGTWIQDKRLHCPQVKGCEHVAAGTPQRVADRQGGETTLPRDVNAKAHPKPPSPARTINIFIGGSNNASINGVKFTASYKLKRSITHEWYDRLKESIIFDESDADGLTFPHNDSLVITLCILDTDVKRIMVDDGRGACIIHPRVLAQMRLEDKIVPRCITLTSFTNAVEWTSREITLTVLADGIMLETIFHIMDHATAYNTIVGQLWIHPMRVVPSDLYQVIKFPTTWEIFSIHGK